MATEEFVFLPSSRFLQFAHVVLPALRPMQRTPEPTQDTPMAPPAEPAAREGAEKTKKRPRLDMAVEPRERKRGKTMFGLLLGTLAKAKNEDKERNASDAVRLVPPLPRSSVY